MYVLVLLNLARLHTGPYCCWCVLQVLKYRAFCQKIIVPLHASSELYPGSRLEPGSPPRV